jgi:hypothetical protein
MPVMQRAALMRAAVSVQRDTAGTGGYLVCVDATEDSVCTTVEAARAIVAKSGDAPPSRLRYVAASATLIDVCATCACVSVSV